MTASATPIANDFPASTPSPPGPDSRPDSANSHRAHLLHAAVSMLNMIVIALFVLTFIAQPFRIPSASMEPTLLVGDFLLVDKMVHTPGNASARPGMLPYREVGRGDIIVFRYPPDTKIHVVKRVIGVPGDRIRLKDGVVYINDRPRQEPYIMPSGSQPDAFRDQFPASLYTDPGVDPQWWAQLRREVRDGEYIVPPGRYFVLGDNRANSRDSRYWGLVPRENIVGSPFLVYFSLRQPSAADVSALPDDKLDLQEDAASSPMGFARWRRMFRVVR